MGTGLRSSLSYHRRLFLLLLAFSWALVACFIVFQYGREKQFKAERLDTRLQLFNLRMLDALADGATPEEFIAARDEPFGDLRVTVIDAAGRVTFDNSAGSPDGVKPFKVLFPETSARYLRVVARTVDPIPAWHGAAGQKAHMFVDEIIVE